MKVALLCSGLGHIRRGHEVFATSLFGLMQDRLDITLFKGGGTPAAREVVVDNIPRQSPLLQDVHVAVSPRWADAVREQERLRIETTTFAFAALKPLMEGGFDVVHCLEQEVCDIVFEHRHLFARPPKVMFSNGGAIARGDLPGCDAVQEYTGYNLARSDRRRGFLIPHGVDTALFSPRRDPAFRRQLGVPDEAFLMLSVGQICYWHKRMDYLIRELAPLADVHLAIVGQDSPDTPAIRRLGADLMGGRISFGSLPHHELPQAYAAADAFVLGSIFETFGIVYIEAMAAGLPVFCTNHPNQRSIVGDGVFLDMARPGSLRQAVAGRDAAHLRELGRKGRLRVEAEFDQSRLAERYTHEYERLASSPSTLPRYGWRLAARARASGLGRRLRRTWQEVTG